ncbi:MAG: IS66 family transposase [Nitrosopumilus sp.]|nr:IS66 family transposase [Nitrosopumilus sp.]MDA7998103.1 IS66 family transposase [Nitrosopumilus sp.]
MAAAEVKILRDELARTHGKVSRLEAQMARMAEEFARAGEAGQRRIAELAAENDEYKRRLAYYENSNRPSSSDSLKGDKRQRERRAARGKKRPAGKRGGRKGHRGASKTRKADKTVHHRVEKCGGCGGTDLEDDGSHTKIVEDVPEIVKAEVTAHVVHGARCNGCGARTRAAEPGIAGTSLGPNALLICAASWEAPGSLRSVAELLKIFGIDITKSAVNSAIAAIAGRMEPEAEVERENVRKSGTVLGDETPNRVNGKRGHTWIFLGDGGSVMLVPATSRAAAVIMDSIPDQDRIVVCDGYQGYNVFRTRQRCWSHILREAEYLKDDAPGYGRLYEMLCRLYHDAKLAPPDGRDMLEIRARSIADGYLRLGCRFGGTLDRAARDLFTFVEHPGVPPTNNESERFLRPVVIHRKIRQRMGSLDGMRVFGTIMTCLLTWRRRGLDVGEQLARVLAA